MTMEGISVTFVNIIYHAEQQIHSKYTRVFATLFNYFVVVHIITIVSTVVWIVLKSFQTQLSYTTCGMEFKSIFFTDLNEIAMRHRLLPCIRTNAPMMVKQRIRKHGEET